MNHRVAKAAPILALIRRHESDHAAKAQGVASAYDVVWAGIAKKDRPKRLTAMTVAKVLWWQDLIDPSYLSEAAGAYQILEDTLRTLDVDPARLFDAACQDDLAVQLLDRRGWAKCEAGKMSPGDFADQLAREWASLPVTRDQKGSERQVKRGQSYYAGDGLNKAGATPEEVMAAISAALAPAADAPPPVDEMVAWMEEGAAMMKQLEAWRARCPSLRL
jgi:muramidase (phage lysozyme)